MANSLTEADMTRANALLDRLGSLFDGQDLATVLIVLTSADRYAALQASPALRAEHVAQLRRMADELEAADAVKH